jgi:hypothetical protein
VRILHPRRDHDDGAVVVGGVGGLCGDDARRTAGVRALVRRLRRNERSPGTVKRAAWRVEQALGSPLRRRGLWPAD